MTDWKEHYRHCPHCGNEHTAYMFEWACKKHERIFCSTECRLADQKKRLACCDKAEQISCVCTYAFQCPIHGTHHLGSHD